MRTAIVIPILLAALVAACAAAAPSPSVSDVILGPGIGGPWLRATTTQALPPPAQFGTNPTVLVTSDGTYVTQGPVPAIFPGPLLPNLIGRSITDAGRAALLREAARLGLLGGAADFTGGAAVPGGILGRLELTIDGRRATLMGDPTASIQCITTPCDPPPGTPAAFGAFWSKLQDPASWLGTEVGPEAAFVPQSYALLVGPAPAPEAGLAPQLLDWPLDVTLGTFGVPVLGGAYRCGRIDGEDAERLAPVLQDATILTQWTQDPSTSATFGLMVRPIIDDEDPCREAFQG